MAGIFPTLAPSRDLTITQPRHPHVAKRSTGGGESRIRLSNVRAVATISLQFENIESAELLAFWGHWHDARGTARDFQITAANLGTIGASAQSQLLSTTWKYAKAPKCSDICGGGPDRLLHTLEIELISQPRRVAAYINPSAPELSLPVAPRLINGGRLVASARIVGATFVANGWSLRGGILTTGFVWVQGGRFATVAGTMPGADLSATAALAAGVRTANPPTAAVSGGAGVSISGGRFTLTGTPPAGVLTNSASISGGTLTIVARSIAGGALTASASLNGGFAGGGPSGKALSSAASMVGGVFDAGYGAVLSATASVGAGAFGGTDANFANVSVLFHFDGANGSTTFTDSSANNITTTRVGTGTISTAQAKFNQSYLNPNSSRLELQGSSLLSFPADFTIEISCYWISKLGPFDTLLEIGNYGNGLMIRPGDDSIYINGFSQWFSSGLLPSFNNWHQLTIIRSGSTVQIYLNAANIRTATITGTVNSYSSASYIGDSTHFPGRAFNGYIDEFRVTKGIARYATGTGANAGKMVHAGTNDLVVFNAPFPNQ